MPKELEKVCQNPFLLAFSDIAKIVNFGEKILMLAELKGFLLNFFGSYLGEV